MAKKMVGMVHVRALPGTPRHTLGLSSIVAKAVEEAAVLVAHGFDAIIIENMHDTPYLMRHVGPEILASMTAVGCAIRARFPRLEIGVQILAGANREAIACAQAFDGSFVRCEGFVFASVADEGIMAEAAAGELLRYRRAIGASSVKVFCDIKKKHSSHAITADVSLAETAKAADFFGADGVIVTGTSTGSPTDLDDVRAARGATRLPVAVGSGVDPSNIGQLWPLADMFIVGSYIKQGGNWANELDVERIQALMNAVKALRAAPAAPAPVHHSAPHATTK